MRARYREVVLSKLCYRKILTEFFSEKILLPEKTYFFAPRPMLQSTHVLLFNTLQLCVILFNANFLIDVLMDILYS